MVQFIKRIWRRNPAVLVIIIAGLAFALGLVISGGESGGSAARHDHTGEEQRQAEVWTCSMHPNIRQPGPGQCPICGMDLIPVSTDEGGDQVGPREITLSAQARKLAEIQVAPVERKAISVEVRLAGMIEYDETRDRKIAAWIPGRLDRLYVDYTGVTVARGEPLVELYSPELLTTQRELLAALTAQNNLVNARSVAVKQTARRTVNAVREKLRLWGLTDRQVEEIEQRGTPSDRVTITAPVGGVVVHKNAVEGMYVKTGTPIYTIADLTHLWVNLDAYEADLAWINEGQPVEFSVGAYPGETFVGTVVFIDPLVNPKTRTVKVRVELPNPTGRLKPGMFVNAVVQAGPTAGQAEKPLVIPASAPLITGKRAVVYVAVPGKEGTYQGREVILGPRAGDYYIVRDGLEEGELVVVNGNFKIDSAIQILAKPSMMSPEGGVKPPVHDHGGESTGDVALEAKPQFEEYDVPEQFSGQIAELFTAYFKIQTALSHDKFPEAKSAATSFMQALDGVDMQLLKGRAHMAWMDQEKAAGESAAALAESGGISKARVVFEPLSESMYAVAAGFGTGGEDSIFQIHCPMAFNNQGADWLQTHTKVENPYFGAKMFKCGKIKDTIISSGAKR